jgi:hypothetical protein
MAVRAIGLVPCISECLSLLSFVKIECAVIVPYFEKLLKYTDQFVSDVMQKEMCVIETIFSRRLVLRLFARLHPFHTALQSNAEWLGDGLSMEEGNRCVSAARIPSLRSVRVPVS